MYSLHCRGEYSQDAYQLLGEIYFAMHDLPRAGAAWLLTERSGEEVERAAAAFYERYGRTPPNILRVVKPHAPSENYPPAVQERLKAWDYRYRNYRSRNAPRAGENILGQRRRSGAGQAAWNRNRLFARGRGSGFDGVFVGIL